MLFCPSGQDWSTIAIIAGEMKTSHFSIKNKTSEIPKHPCISRYVLAVFIHVCQAIIMSSVSHHPYGTPPFSTQNTYVWYIYGTSAHIRT